MAGFGQDMLFRSTLATRALRRGIACFLSYGVDLSDSNDARNLPFSSVRVTKTSAGGQEQDFTSSLGNSGGDGSCTGLGAAERANFPAGTRLLAGRALQAGASFTVDIVVTLPLAAYGSPAFSANDIRRTTMAQTLASGDAGALFDAVRRAGLLDALLLRDASRPVSGVALSVTSVNKLDANNRPVGGTSYASPVVGPSAGMEAGGLAGLAVGIVIVVGLIAVAWAYHKRSKNSIVGGSGHAEEDDKVAGSNPAFKRAAGAGR